MAYAVISLVGFLLGAALLLLFVGWAEKLIRLGLDEKVFYVLLLPLGLCAAAFLFGAMNSFAAHRGQVLSGRLTLGGPAVIFVLVVFTGLQLVPKTAPFSMTVFAHEVGNPAARLTSGTLKLTYGDVTVSGDLDQNGRATYTSIPRTYLGQKAYFALESRAHMLAEPAREHTLAEGSLYLPVKINDSLVTILGRVSDESGRQPLGDAQVMVDGHSASSDTTGVFKLVMPAGKLSPSYSVLVQRMGFEAQRLTYWPNSGTLEVRLKKSK